MPPRDGRKKQTRIARVIDAYLRHRFAWLFFTLLLTLGLAPARRVLIPNFPLDFLLALNLLAAIACAAHERWVRWLMLLGLAFVFVRGIQALTGTQVILSLSQVLWVLTTGLAGAACVHYAIRAGRVDAARIFAALDAYLLAGLMFGICFYLLDQTWPGSFNPESETPLALPHAIYFSFVTIATLGYGDIVPASELARALAILEAISGQLYLVVLVARLVSLYAQQADDDLRA
jgi:hypothetical protein